MTEEEKNAEEAKVLHKTHQNERTLACLKSKGNRMAEEMAQMISVLQWERTEENTFELPPELYSNWKDNWPSTEKLASHIKEVKKTKDLLRGLYMEADRMKLNYDRKFND